MGFAWLCYLSWGFRLLRRLVNSFSLQLCVYLGVSMISRMIYVRVAPNQIQEAIEDWKEVCAPIMISQPGCLSEELLACNEQPDEFISLSNWESMEAIQAYRTSEAHERVKHGTRGIKADVVVKTYTVIG